MTQTSAKGQATTIELSRAGQVLARRAAESRATVPTFELSETVAVGDAPAHPVDRAISALAQALADHPLGNASYRDGRIEQHERVNVAIALSHGDAQLAPVISDAPAKDEAQIAAERETLTAEAAAGTLTAPQQSGATVTVQALDVERFAPLVTPGQAVALGVGRVKDGVVVLTLVCDHRVLFGEAAAALLRAVADRF